jgi:hypothetical protein
MLFPNETDSEISNFLLIGLVSPEHPSCHDIKKFDSSSRSGIPGSDFLPSVLFMQHATSFNESNSSLYGKDRGL